MTIMGEPGGKGRSIVKGVLWFSFGLLKLLLKGVDFLPILKHFLFLLREVRSLGDYVVLSI